MNLYKFGDRVKTHENKIGIVQENQVMNSKEVKVLFEGEDYSHVLNDDELEIDA
jgi:hypothetical protein